MLTRRHRIRFTMTAILTCVTLVTQLEPVWAQESVARIWNEALLDAIRRDQARPTVHARNLFHVSIAMWDAWAAFEPRAKNYLLEEKYTVDDVDVTREIAMSIAVYQVLRHRFAESPGVEASLAAFDSTMETLGYNYESLSNEAALPFRVGTAIADAVLQFGLNDGSNEQNGFASTTGYEPVNEPMVVALPGTVMADPNRWQPLALDYSEEDSEIILGPYPPHLTPHWSSVTPFALLDSDRSPNTHFDPGLPPQLGGERSEVFMANTVHLIEVSSYLDPDDGVYIDISPASRGNAPLGSYAGTGHELNPVTQERYHANIVKRGDYARILAEFWADGPDSETPPGHWNTIANYVSDHPLLEKRIGGEGAVVSDLEWDVKLYLALNGALHDAAICAWGAKAFYDSSRPISNIRYMAGLGQSSEPEAEDYHPLGLPLIPGLIERITTESAGPGSRHAHLAEFIGELALRAWPGAPTDPAMEYSGVQWHRALLWMPYQRPSFVSPPFAGYVSGHSTFSRAAAEVLASITGTPYFPGGLGEFYAPQDGFLIFEAGPSEDVYLQWATYYDAADESGLSRIYGGIHPRHDDISGRILGDNVGRRAWSEALHYYEDVGAEGEGEGEGEGEETPMSCLLPRQGGSPAPAQIGDVFFLSATLLALLSWRSLGTGSHHGPRRNDGRS